MLFSIFFGFKRNRIPLNENPKTPFFKWNIEELDKNQLYPWEDVFECPIFPLPIYSEYICIECLAKLNKPIEELTKEEIKSLKANYVTINFRSPSETWRNLCGREGYLIICMEHKQQIDFKSTKLS